MMDGLMKSKYVKREYECSERIDQLRIDSKTDAIRITSGDVMRVRISFWVEYTIHLKTQPLKWLFRGISQVRWM